MAAKKSKSASTAESAPAAGDALLKAVTKGIKMVKRHSAYQEPDVEATQSDDRSPYDGPNPFREGTSAHIGFERGKKSQKGA